MSLDPCNLMPFADKEHAPPAPAHHRAAHHVLGRIWRHRPRLLPVPAQHDPLRSREGCEAHVPLGGIRSRAAPRRLPPLITPALPIVTGATLFGISAWAIVGPTRATRHATHGHHPVAVLEPGSLFLLLSGLGALALVCCLARPRRLPR